MAESLLQHPSPAPVASARHTVGLIVGLLALSVVGAVVQPISVWPEALAAPPARILLYVQILLVQWLTFAYVWLGIRRSNTSMRGLIEERRLSAARWLRCAAVAIAGWVVWLAVGAALAATLAPTPEQLRGLQAMLPTTPPESGLWVAFSLSAGVCEEVVYRGYLLRQFRALTGNTFGALLLQAFTYGLAHLTLPMEMVASVSLLGLLLGGLAVWQKSLVPGMIMHAGIGLFVIVAPGN